LVHGFWNLYFEICDLCGHFSEVAFETFSDGGEVMQLLAGITVLDFTQFLAGSYCAMLLGDLGANVIKIERPETGEVYRTYGPKFIQGESTSFLSVNRNKRSLTLNLKDPRGVTLALRMIEGADVLVENFKPGVMEELGLGFAQASKKNLRLIYCSISGFGQTGPYRNRGGFDLVLQGMSGMMSTTGEADGPPVKVGYPVTDMGAGIYGAFGILAALFHRNTTGKGQWVDTSLLEAGLAWSLLPAGNYFADGEIQKRLGSASAQNAPYQAFETSDGFINLGTGNEKLWIKFCEVIGLQCLPDDPRFENNALRVKNQRELAKEIEPAMKRKTTREWTKLLDEAEIPCGPIYNIEEALSDEQALSRRMVVEFAHPKAGRVKSLGFPVKFSESEFCVRRYPPLLGEHNHEILASLGLSQAEIDNLARDRVI
jgi:crotonobetainyl-CoA:carnitine CoA-transferase CaiB-like acyl-CoA transferase